MSFKEFSASHETPGKDAAAEKAKEALPANAPTTRPGQKPEVAAPAPKA